MMNLPTLDVSATIDENNKNQMTNITAQRTGNSTFFSSINAIKYYKSNESNPNSMSTTLQANKKVEVTEADIKVFKRQ